MVEGKDDEAVMYVNSEAGFGSLRIVKGVDRLIYISDTHMEEEHRYSTIKQTIYIEIYLPIAIDLLDLEVKPQRYSCVLSISSVSQSTRILLY